MRLEAPSVRERNPKPARPMHHVAVRQNKAVRREDEAGAAAAQLHRTGWRWLPIIRSLSDFNIDDRWADPLRRRGHRSGIGIEEVVIRLKYRWSRTGALGTLIGYEPKNSLHLSLLHR